MPKSRNRKNHKQKVKARNEELRGRIKKQKEYMMKMLNDSLMSKLGGANAETPQTQNS